MPEPTVTNVKPPPKQARAAAKRAAILDATEALLQDHAPASVTTRLVAERADVPVGSVYRYFANADDLLSALFNRMNAGTVSLLRKTLSDDGNSNDGNGTDTAADWRAQVDRTFDNLTQMHAGHPAYGALMAHLDRNEEEDEIAVLLDALVTRDAPHLPKPLAREIVRTVMAMIDGVERRLHRLPDTQKSAALDQARIAVTAYLAHHLDPHA